eukprot:CAMPEP_0197650390 /NCGR_PEP_ID=MMETSP1338-20131121/30916_1 /TAXON_ID=43686 ORGANISM="Pelagodinium beii, Strain RCC1491" /NCGR_SAMPLE_ID=MMETSP1338 /ASSEMBLY_ACC=CAM_ASM_000754 /LENGTH=241 /DNA_ID=CAMNT_0043224787 /DNA_START=67 /DNA_END=789 /DNA_ORIENTATION=-
MFWCCKDAGTSGEEVFKAPPHLDESLVVPAPAKQAEAQEVDPAVPAGKLEEPAEEPSTQPPSEEATPPAPEATKVVRLERKPGEGLGIETSLLDEQVLLVLSASGVADAAGVRRGHRILTVNGLGGTPKELVSKMKSVAAGTLEIVVENAQEKLVKIEKKGRPLSLSMNVDPQPQGPKENVIFISSVLKGGGVAHEMNEAEPGTFKSHDAIAEVDGESGTAQKLLSKMKEKQAFEVKIFRW